MAKGGRPKKAVSRIRLLRSIYAGKTIKQIAQEKRLPYSRMHRKVDDVKRGLKPESREKLKEQINANRGKKFDPRSAKELTSFAKKAIRGEIFLFSQSPWKTSFPSYYEKHPKTLKKVVHLLRSTGKSFTQIGQETGVGYGTISKSYKLLKGFGEDIAERGLHARPSKRQQSRITGFFNQKQVTGIVNSYEKRIVHTANKFYNVYKPYFDFKNITAEGIADYIRDSLEWKVKTFDLSKRKGKSLKLELQKYCCQQIKFLALDKVKQVKRNHKKVVSLEQGKGIDGEAGLRLKDIIAAKEQKSASPEEMIELIEKISRQSKLDTKEKAIFYGKVAGMTHGEMATMAGTNNSFIGYISMTTRKKMLAAGYKPIRRELR